MKNTWVALFLAITAFVSIPISAKANSAISTAALPSEAAMPESIPLQPMARSFRGCWYGTTSPDQTLTVVGTVHSTTGGVEFPDGTTQTTRLQAGSHLSIWLRYHVGDLIPHPRDIWSVTDQRSPARPMPPCFLQ